MQCREEREEDKRHRRIRFSDLVLLQLTHFVRPTRKALPGTRRTMGWLSWLQRVCSLLPTPGTLSC
jgi:hypothetical protein